MSAPSSPKSSLHRTPAIAATLLVLSLVGCELRPFPGFSASPPKAASSWQLTGPEGTSATATPGAPTTPGGIPGLPGGVTAGAPLDPAPNSRIGARMDVWAVSVPRGAVSANETFWKRVDELAVSPDRYERLFVNGFRVGVGRADQWEYFRDLLSRHPARHQLNAVTAFDETTVEVPVRRGVEVQTLGYFGPDGLELRTFDRSDNVISLSFIPAPRRTDAVRVALTPIVRSQRERLEATAPSGPDGDRTIRSVRPERLYNLSLAVEVPFGQFLVISPSTDTARETSIGRNFLLLDRDAEQNELVLLIVPTRVELREDQGIAPGSTRPLTPGP